MITFFEANLVKLAVHHVGNPVMDEGLSISEQESDLSDELKRQLLTNYFLLPFQKTVQIFNFHHPSGNRELNHVNSLAEYLFTGEFSFLEASEGLGRALYAASNHPKIKSGELYIALFENVQIEGELLPAIGIFKSEAKETYLKINPSAAAFEVGYEQEAVNINRLDKGCLIFNSFHAENGYKVAVIDNSSKSDHSYWTDEFLQLKVRNDNFNQTGNLLNIYKYFVTEKLDDEFEVSKSDKIDLLNRGLKYFEEKEAFDLEEFNEEVIVGIAAAESFTNFKQQFQEEFETPIADTFEISDTAVKKQASTFKKVLKLDKNFKLHISGNKSLIERGYDQDKALNYYKVYFKEESL